MATEQGNTADNDQQAALAAERERIEKLEKQVSDKQAMIDRQSNEIGKVRELERKIEELEKGKDDDQIKTLSGKIAELEAKIEGAKKPDASATASGTNPPPPEDRKRDDALAALKDAFAKLTDEQREAVEQEAIKMAEAQGADISDVEQRAVLVEHAVRGLGITTATAKKVSIWDGIAPKQPEVSAAERLRQALSGEGERQPPRVTGSAFGPESGRTVGSAGSEPPGERPFLGMSEELDKLRKRLKKE